MDIEQLRDFCLSQPHTTEDIKWGENLCFSIGAKLFLLISTDEVFSVTFKVDEEEFEELADRDGIIQASYFAKRKWINIKDEGALSGQEWSRLATNAYLMVKSNLPKKRQDELQ